MTFLNIFIVNVTILFVSKQFYCYSTKRRSSLVFSLWFHLAWG